MPPIRHILLSLQPEAVIQWNPSILDTFRTKYSAVQRGVLILGVSLHTFGTLQSVLNNSYRCPQFQGSRIEGFHCISECTQINVIS